MLWMMLSHVLRMLQWESKAMTLWCGQNVHLNGFNEYTALLLLYFHNWCANNGMSNKQNACKYRYKLTRYVITITHMHMHTSIILFLKAQVISHLFHYCLNFHCAEPIAHLVQSFRSHIPSKLATFFWAAANICRLMFLTIALWTQKSIGHQTLWSI